MNTRIVNSLGLTCVLCLVFASIASGQTVLGTLEGRVTDASGKPIAGANITLTVEETGQKREAVTSADGEYSLTLLPPGPCRLEASKAGFGSHGQSLTLLTDAKTRVNITLTQGRSERVEVTAPATPLRSESGAISVVIENRSVTQLPLDGRNFYDLSLLLPGVVPAAQGSAGSVRGDFAINVNGGREDSNNFVLDGVYNNDPKLNGVGTQPPVDAIREFEVLTNSYDASFGRNAAAQVNVVTQSGGNKWHGVAYDFFRNSALDSFNDSATTGQPHTEG